MIFQNSVLLLEYLFRHTKKLDCIISHMMENRLDFRINPRYYVTDLFKPDLKLNVTVEMVYYF